eukprot:scaffold1388_cov390-Prasinococcus_capsulatus_cf.AAC.14
MANLGSRLSLRLLQELVYAFSFTDMRPVHGPCHASPRRGLWWRSTRRGSYLHCTAQDVCICRLNSLKGSAYVGTREISRRVCVVRALPISRKPERARPLQLHAQASTSWTRTVARPQSAEPCSTLTLSRRSAHI